MKEQRISEVRADELAGSGGMVIQGRAIVFEQPTTIHDPAGEYIEVIKRGALDGADLTDSTLIYNHDLTRVPLARTPKTMQLRIDPAGLDMVAELPDTEDARSVYQGVKRGDLRGLSFAFVVPQGGDSFDPATNTRTIHKISKVYEISVCPFPAYPTTSVEARSAINSSVSRWQAIKKCNAILLHG